jgi:hypothetical protein
VIASKRLLLLLPLALALLSPRARAQSSGTNANVAEALFREGVKLFDEGHIREACDKFAESFRLDPANGTLQDLALCHERQGKIASAWAEYTQLIGRATQSKQPARVELAKNRAAELEPRVPRVRLVFGEDANVERVAIDGEAIGRAAWSTALPIDPGDHVLTFAAPRFVDASRTVTVAQEGATIDVDVPRLAPASPEPSAAPSNPSRRTVAWILGGAGVVAIGVGGFFGLRAIANKNDGDAHCAGRFCDATGMSLQDDAHTAATISTIAFGAGALALGGAAFLFLTPSVGPRSAALRAEVRF